MQSPIDAFVAGILDEDQLVSEVDHVLATGSSEEKATLLGSFERHGEMLPRDTLHKIKKKVESQHASSNGRRSANVGDTLNRRFVLKEKLGSGGMGTVFKALDLRRQEAEDRNPYVALKLIKAEAIDHPEAVKILQREARKTQRLAHPNVVMVYDYDRDGDLSYITMELLDGETLSKVLARRRGDPLPASTSGEIIEQIASALDAAHTIGLVHLDLKPANIFVERNGHVKIIDFGISKMLAQRNSADATLFDIRKLGALTPAYASIEMLLGEDVDARDDVFGFACIVYEIVSGKHPFNGKPATVALASNLKPVRPAGLTDYQWKALRSGLDFDKSKRTITAKQIANSLSKRGASNRSIDNERVLASVPAHFHKQRLLLGAGLGAAALGATLVGLVLAYSESGVRQVLPLSAGAATSSADRQQAEAASRAAAASKAAKEAQRVDAARRAAAEEAQRAEAARRAAEEAQRVDAARRAAEEAQQAEGARRAVEEAQQAEATRKVQAALKRARGAIRARPDEDRSQNALRAQPDQENPREATRSRPDEGHPRPEDLDRLEQGNGEESARLREEEDARLQREIAEQEARNQEIIRARQRAGQIQGGGHAQPDNGQPGNGQ